ncbi:MAG: type IV secretory system conjugative DNA transfer family protein [Bacillota bacterium]
MEKSISVVVLCVVVGAFVLMMFLLDKKTLNIKSKTVGDGQHGSARFATAKEISETFRRVKYEPEKWRKGGAKDLPQGILLGCQISRKKVMTIVEEGDVHTLMIGAAGVGKTAKFLYPNLEYCCASGMSFLTTDTKGDVLRAYAPIAEKYYGYEIAVIDLRNPTQSDGFNMMNLVNRYMDEYLETNELTAKAKCEKYAKILSKTIITSGGNDSASAGQNAFFYDSAEGLLTAVILLVAEFCSPLATETVHLEKEAVEQRHIVSVFKMIQDLLAPSQDKKEKGKSEFKVLMEKLPSEHKARWLSGAALNTSDQAMASVLSTALSRLNAFLDSEIEQLLCFGTKINTEDFCKKKSAIFLVMPEEDPSKYFLISLIVQQLYREMLSVADEFGGKLPNRVMFFLDEFGTLPKIESAEMMFSASRSRRISFVAIIQSLAQLQKNYGKEGAEILVDNAQVSIYGGFAPNSETANILSKNLGEKTVMTGSVSHGKDKSKSLQMTGRPLITADELKVLPKDIFIITRTGVCPMKSTYKLFFDWGIDLDLPYESPISTVKKVHYADKNFVEEKVIEKYQKPVVVPEKVVRNFDDMLMDFSEDEDGDADQTEEKVELRNEKKSRLKT